MGAAIKAQGAEKADEIQKIEARVILMSEEALAEIVAFLGLIPVAPDPAEKKCKREGGERAWVRKSDEELRIVWAEVYVPIENGLLDSHGDFMTADEIRKMAHQFLAEGLTGQVDVNHDNDISRGAVVVESFIACEEDTLFIPGSWVCGIHIPDDDLWGKVKSGEINGFSMQAAVFMRSKTLEIEINEEPSGNTEISSTGDLHSHEFAVRFSAEGEFLGGRTSVIDGHDHEVKRGSVTEPGGKDRHTHRYSLIDAVLADARATAPDGVG